MLVCGHWRVVDFHFWYGDAVEDKDDIYFGEHLIALDACTAATQVVNVLVIQDGICKAAVDGSALKTSHRNYPKIETVTL